MLKKKKKKGFASITVMILLLAAMIFTCSLLNIYKGSLSISNYSYKKAAAYKKSEILAMQVYQDIKDIKNQSKDPRSLNESIQNYVIDNPRKVQSIGIGVAGNQVEIKYSLNVDIFQSDCTAYLEFDSNDIKIIGTNINLVQK